MHSNLYRILIKCAVFACAAIMARLTASGDVVPAISAGDGMLAASNGIFYASAKFFTLMIDGSVWAWGYNGNGDLGDGSGPSVVVRKVPVLIPNFNDVKAISGGGVWGPSLAIKSDDTAWGWGVVVNLTSPSTYCTNRPTPITGANNIAAVASGEDFMLVLKNDRTVWAGGNNRYGQWGDGTFDTRAGLWPTVGMNRVRAIDARGWSGLAAKEDGTVWAWGLIGLNSDYTYQYWSTPGQVLGLTDIVDVKLSAYKNLALKNDGKVGQWSQSGGAYADYPVPVSQLMNVTAIACGSFHCLALRGEGTVWSWGYGSSGQLGDGTYTNRRDIPVPVANLFNVIAIAAASDVSMALRSDGTVWAWGGNRYGELGDGTTSNQCLPVQVLQLPNVYLPPPSGVSASDGAYQDRVRIMWNTVPTAKRYQVWRCDLENTALAELLGETYITQYDDLQIELDTPYYYWVKTVGTNGTSGFGTADRGYRSVTGTIPLPPGTYTPVTGDFDRDGRADPAVLRAENGDWYIWMSSGGYTRVGPIALGVAGLPDAADFDGDGRADPAVCDTAGNWYIWLSALDYYPVGPVPLGIAGMPAAGDFDGDRRADPAICTSDGNWYFWFSHLDYYRIGPYPLGAIGTAMAADFDGDQRADLAVCDAAGNWSVFLSISEYGLTGPFYLGLTEGIPVAGDFDGDGYADPTAYQRASGRWVSALSGQNYTLTVLPLP